MNWATVLIAGVLLGSSALVNAKVDINVADQATLVQGLSGVGQKKAQAIIAYRNTNGPFQDIEELASVDGIGEKLLALNRDEISLGDTRQ